jgi:hypothetical protein
MRSPFPGMDPYLEACGLWGDFHQHLIEKIYEHLADRVPERYVVRTAERSYVVLVESQAETRRSMIPDVSVMAPRTRGKRPKKGGAAVAEPAGDAEPVTMRAFIEEEHREAFVEIYETEVEPRLVTAVEVLSPTNKRPRSEGRDLYLRKRQSLLVGGVNLVEIDLLRGGERMPMLDPWPASPYVLLVARAYKTQSCRVWPAHFRRPLPSLPVPLTKPDADILIELQPIIEAIWQRARYSRSIDYRRPLTPPVADEDAAWLAEQLRRRSKDR